MKLRMILAGLVAGLSVVPAAQAAPVTVDLRVEGPTRTLVEQRVTFDVAPFRFSDSPTAYTCDATGPNSQGAGTVPKPTRNVALSQAAATGRFELLGTFSSFGPTFSRINGEDVGYDPASGKYLVEYQDGVAADFGGCGQAIADGGEALFAYGTGSEQLLRLSGPATVRPGEAAPLTVADRTTGQGVAGATVAGRTTGADGKLTTDPLTARGPVTFKAERPGAIRSNAVTVCVTDGTDGFCGSGTPGSPAAPGAPSAPAAPCFTLGDDGFCGTPDRRAGFGDIGSVRDGQRFARGKGPRELTGTVDRETQVADVRLRLTGRRGRTCLTYDGRRERVVRARRCGAAGGTFFSIGDAASWRLLLPQRLGTGRWVLDVEVRDRAGNVNRTLQRDRSRVVFRVG
jgi:hypothetical protein